ncbi:hypothetical protein M3D57_10955, partial [Corynebacterium sanguinis]|uniref:hypothetical protein n=1 Tax=Corynebacterium sanguinis TaxID=2594913 RepID=UPI00223C150A
ASTFVGSGLDLYFRKGRGSSVANVFKSATSIADQIQLLRSRGIETPSGSSKYGVVEVSKVALCLQNNISENS